MTTDRPRSFDVTTVVVAAVDSPYLSSTLADLSAQTRAPQRVLLAVLERSDGADDEGRATRLLAEAGLGQDRPEQLAPDGVDVVTLGPSRGYSDAVHRALAATEDPIGWLWLLHDDSAPGPRALAALLRAVEDSHSIAIAGSKQVEWDAPDQLISVGTSFTVDGQRFTGIEDGEIDQGQHDGQEDVYAVGTAGMLIEATMWRALGGADVALGSFADGADLSRRARLAGRRVVVVPHAVIRHARAGYYGLRTKAGARTHEPVRADPRRSYRARREARLHSWLTHARLPLVPLVAVLALVLALPRALWRVATNELALAGDEIIAPLAALGRFPAVARARRRARRTRKVPTRRLAPLRVSWGQVWRQRRHRRMQAVAERRAARAPSELEMAERAAVATKRRFTLASVLTVAAALSLLMLAPVAFSGALTGGALLPVDGTFAQVWQAALGPWIASGDGYVGPPDPFLLLLGALSAITGGPLGTPVQVSVAVLLVLAIPLAAAGAWFAAGAATRSVLVRAWAAGVWAFGPALLIGLGQGRLGAVLAHLALPFVALGIARSLGLDRRDMVISGMVGAQRVTKRPVSKRRSARVAKRERLAALARVGADSSGSDSTGESTGAVDATEATGVEEAEAQAIEADIAGIKGGEPTGAALTGRGPERDPDAAGSAPEQAGDPSVDDVGADDAGADEEGDAGLDGRDPADAGSAASDSAERDAADGAAADSADASSADSDWTNGDSADGAAADSTDSADSSSTESNSADNDVPAPERDSAPLAAARTSSTTPAPARGLRGRLRQSTGAASSDLEGLEPIRSNTDDDYVPAEDLERATVVSRISRAGSLGAAAAAGLAFAVASAGAPVLLPAGLLALVLLALALGRRRSVPAGRARLLLVALPALALMGPVWSRAIATWGEGGWRLLFADPGTPLASDPGPAWLTLLGWPTLPPFDQAHLLFDGALAPWLPVAATGTVVLAATASLVRGAGHGRAARLGWLVAVVGLATALASSRVVVGFGRGVAEHAGTDQLVTGWAGPGTSLLLLGLLLATVSAMDGLRGALAPRAFGWRQLGTAALAVVVVLGLGASALSWMAGTITERRAGEHTAVMITDRGPDPVPALGESVQTPDQSARVLGLSATEAGIDAQIWRGQGPQLTETSTVVSLNRALEVERDAEEPFLDAADEHLAALVADLATGSVEEAAGRLTEHAVAVVIVPPADSRATGVSRPDDAARTRLIAQLDSVLGLDRVTENASGVIWRVRAGTGSTDDSIARVQVLDGDRELIRTVHSEGIGVRSGIDAEGTDRTVVLAERADAAWRAEIDGRALRAVPSGWQQGFLIPDDAHGLLTVDYRPNLHGPWQVVTLVVLVLAGLLALPTRRRRAEEA